MEVLAARILAHGEDAEMVESMAAAIQQQQLQQQPGKYLTDLDAGDVLATSAGGVEGRSSPISDNAVLRADTDSLISNAGSGASSSSSASSLSSSPATRPANRYSYRAAIYQNPENQQDIG